MRVLIAAATVALAAVVAWECIAPSTPTGLLGLSDLDRAHETLMSCADGEGESREPMWCANGTSSRCMPAAPESPAPDLTDHSAPAALLVGEAKRLAYVLVPWPAPTVRGGTAPFHGTRLERPPRV